MHKIGKFNNVLSQAGDVQNQNPRSSTFSNIPGFLGSNSLPYLYKTASLIWGYKCYRWQAVSKSLYDFVLIVIFLILQINLYRIYNYSY